MLGAPLFAPLLGEKLLGARLFVRRGDEAHARALLEPMPPETGQRGAGRRVLGLLRQRGVEKVRRLGKREGDLARRIVFSRESYGAARRTAMPR